MNSPALVLPSSASSTPGSEMAIINRTDGLGLDTSPVMKTPPKLEGDATDGSFANKHGRHVIGHTDDYSALRQQIAEGKLLVKKIVSLVRSACSFPGLEAQGTEGESTERELLELRTKVSKQERLLQSTAEHLKNANQQESMEQFIISQITRTHDVLKKARTNLEVKSLRALPCTPAL
ncbi:myomegalin-like isoform X2 [Pongo abelii]|uniref:myomegalin-like isoform X2 n=1 Tax=Pongo abelii TaxID=9601 RepID=UPI0030055F7B